MMMSVGKGFFHRVGGVAALSLRAALRSRTALALLGLLAACALILPRAVKGDGTPEGALRIHLSYTVGFSFGLLALASLWASCSLFAGDIDSGRIRLTAVKPVRAGELWLGKWLALLAVDALLVAAVYGGVYAQIRLLGGGGGAARPAAPPPCRYVSRPLLPPPADEAREVYAQMAREGLLPTNLTRRAILRTLAQKALERYTVINPGGDAQWDFELTRPLPPGAPVAVRLRFDTEFSTRSSVRGVCRLSRPERPGRALETPLLDFTQNEIEFTVDSSGLFAAGERPEPLRRLRLSFLNRSDEKRASALMLRFRRDVAVLTPGGPFGANLVRSAFIHWCVLAVLCAFGLTLGACLSLPVAAFSATLLLTLCLVGNSVAPLISAEDEADWRNLPGLWVSRAVRGAARHALEASPLDAVTRGERLETRLLLSAAGWDLLLAPCCLALAGCWLLSRRELAASG